MTESIIISILFIGATIYLIVLLKKTFQVKETGCAKGCGSCSPTTPKEENKQNTVII